MSNFFLLKEEAILRSDHQERPDQQRLGQEEVLEISAHNVQNITTMCWLRDAFKKKKRI